MERIMKGICKVLMFALSLREVMSFSRSCGGGAKAGARSRRNDRGQAFVPGI